MPRAPKIVTFDAAVVLQFLGSVALAQAVLAHTNVQWRDYNDSKVLNAVYTVFFWKQKPGFVEVDQDWRQIAARRDELWKKYVAAFFRKASQSPREAIEYLEAMETVKASAIQSVQQTFRDASNINAEIIGATTETIRHLALVKAGSVITIAALTGGLAIVGSGMAATASTIGVGTSVGMSVAKNLNEARTADVVAIDTGEEPLLSSGEEAVVKDTAKAAGGNWIAQPLGEGAVRWLATRPAVLAAASRIGLLNDMQGAVKAYSEQLARARAESLKRKLAGRIASAEQRTAARRMAFAKGAARVVPVIFAVSDIIGAVDEYYQDTQ